MSHSSPLRALTLCLVAAVPLAAQRGLFVEPFGARVLANPRVTLQDQTLRGIEGGVILGGLELAGQWAQAASADFRTARPAQLVGGTVRLPLPPLLAAHPYLAAGGSRLTFDDGFTASGARPRDRWIGELGGGVLVPLYGGVQLDVGVRDLVIRADSAAGPLDTTRILTHNVQLRVGLRLQFGGPRAASRATTTVIVEPAAPRRAAPAREVTPAAAPRTDARVRPVPVLVPATVPNTQVVVRTPGEPGAGAPMLVALPPASPLPGQVSFPAPTVGEVTIRYGAPGAHGAPGGSESAALATASAARVADSTLARLRAELDRAITDLLRTATPAPTAARGRTTAPTPSPLQHFADSVRRHDVAVALQRYVDAYSTARSQRLADAMAATLGGERDERARLERRLDSLVALRALDDSLAGARRAADSLATLALDLIPRDPLLLVAGVSAGIGTEAIVGGRVDLGTPVRRLPMVHLIGELGVGAGTLGTSTAISGLAQYRLPPLRGTYLFADAGLSLLNLTTARAGLSRGLSLVPDVGLGAYLPVGPRDAQGRGRLVVLWRGLNASRVNRLLVAWAIR